MIFSKRNQATTTTAASNGMLSLLLSSLIATCEGYELTIHNANELVKFADEVNNGVLYNGVTVLLGDDIEFTDELSGQFTPIGQELKKYFPGTFDGQGYTIKNLVMNASLKYAGLFGYSNGLTVKNVVLDSSCSFMNSLVSPYSYGYLGSIIGHCLTKYSKCNVENTVNLANTAFVGNVSYDFCLGGIAGFTRTSSYVSAVRNCANYGSVTFSGATTLDTYVGGIVGHSDGTPSSVRTFIQNCLNYGNITYTGITRRNLYIGGITGMAMYNGVENSVLFGTITSSTESNYTGTIAGYLNNAPVTNCYFNDKNSYNFYGNMEDSAVSDSATFDDDEYALNKAVYVGQHSESTLVNALNTAAEYYASRNYSRWIINKDQNKVKFIVNEAHVLVLNYEVTLLPDLANRDRIRFDGWYTDANCTQPLTSFVVDSSKDLYAIFGESDKNFTITFDTTGGSPIEPISARYLDTVTLPNTTTKPKYDFAFWVTENGEKMATTFPMPAHNITLYAVWILTHIGDAEDLIEFSNIVNTGMTKYFGTTVYLDADIEFNDELSWRFQPIGKVRNLYFLGTFDGQGHSISNLTVNTTSSYQALFGYSDTLTIKNVVIDESCSIASPLDAGKYTSFYVGGVMGFCYGFYGACNIENNVNMMNITFNGDLATRVTSYTYLYLGGVVGCLRSFNFVSTAKGCINYGAVEFLEDAKDMELYIGGILGGSFAIETFKVKLIDCVNYGAVTFDGEKTNSYLNIGGIVGNSKSCDIVNCENYGEVSAASTRHSWGILGILLLFFILI